MCWLVLMATASAQAPPSAARFDINGYAVEGTPLLRSEDFSRIVSPFIGKQKNAADVQKAQQAVQQAYLDLGYCSVQVTVPKVEPDAGTVILRLVQSRVPVSKDCLPMVVLDEKRAAPVPVAPGEAAVMPFTDVTQAETETPPPSQAPSQIARAPLKPLQDRPASVVPGPSASQPEIAVARALPPADVAVKSLAQAPSQPALIVTPVTPVPIEKPVAVAPPPAIASAPLPKPKPEIALAPAPQPSPKIEPPPVAASPIVAAPVSPPVTPIAPVTPMPAPVVALAPQPEAKPAPKPQPVVEPVKEQLAAKPEIAPVPVPQPIVADKPVEKPAPEMMAAIPVKPQAVPSVAPPLTPTPAPSVAVVEPIKPAPPAPIIAAAPQPEVKPVPKPQPVVEPVKEQIAAKPEVAQAPTPQPSVAEKPTPDMVAMAPTKPEAASPEVTKPIVPAPAVTPEPVVASRVVEATPPVIAEPVKPAPVVAEGRKKPVPEITPAPKAEVAPVAKPEVVSPPVVVAEKPAETLLPALATTPKPAATPAVAAAPAPAPEPQPAAQTAVAPASGEVVVRPLIGALATAPEPREPVEVKSAAERAPVRPLQDRPAAMTQEQPTPRVTEAPEQKPPSVVVQAPVVPIPAPAETATPVESAAAPAALKFDIDRYLVEGNTLLKPESIGRVLESYTGKQKDFADVQRALEALQIAYQKAGWGAVQVTLPEQELERGEVRFEVVETRIGKVEVQGNQYFSEANIRRSVPSLQEGQTPNSLTMARSLKVANESPAKQAQVSLKSGSKDGEVDATIKVVDDNPRKYSVSLDNTGTSSTGRFRLGFGFQHANFANLDHQLTVQYITNPEHVNKVTIFGAGYHVPIYGRGDSVDFILGYSDVDSGTVQQLFNVSGAGLIMLGRYNQNLNRIDDYEHKITYGIDYKAFSNKVLTTSGVPLVPDITLHPVSVAYSGSWKKDQSDLNFYASFTYNPFEGGNDAAQSDFRASRGSGGGASAEYSILRYGATYTWLLPEDWTLRLTGNGQTTRNALVAGEQFGVGGANSVRGFNERTYSMDSGYQASAEIYTPDIAGKLGLAGARLKLLAFWDTGELHRNFIQPGEQDGLTISSKGLGLRLTFRENFSMRLDYAQVHHDGGQDAGIRDGRRNSNTVHASAILVY